MKKKVLFIPLALLLAISLVAIGCPAEEEEAKELVIGAIDGLSGAGSEAIARSADGKNAAVDWVNDKGGLTINGEKYLIKMIAEDSMMSIDGSLAAATKLVYDHKVKFVVVTVPVPPFKAAITELLESNKVLRVDEDGLGSPSELTADMSYTFVAFFDNVPHFVGYDYFVEFYPEVKKVAMVCVEDPSGIAVIEFTLRPQALAHGLTVVCEETYPFGTTDFYPMWTKVLAAEPDAVVIGCGMPQWYGSIIKQGRELGFEGPFYGTGQGGGDPSTIIDIAGNFATDVLVCSYDLKSPEMTPMIKEIAGIIPDKFGREACTDDILGWETLWCMTQAIEAAQSLDPTVVRDTFEKMESIETPCGTGKMGGLETYGINHVIIRPAALTRIMNGEAEFITWFMPELP